MISNIYDVNTSNNNLERQKNRNNTCYAQESLLNDLLMLSVVENISEQRNIIKST